MSFDIFLSCMSVGEVSTFKRSLAQEILGRGAVKEEDALYQVEYPDGSGSSVYFDEDEDEDVDGAMFNHSGGDTFFERLWELADRTNSMIYWIADGTPVAVTRPELLQFIPKNDESDPWEPQFVVKNGKELQDVIAQTG